MRLIESRHALITSAILPDIIALEGLARPEDVREVEDISGKTLIDNLMFALANAKPCLTARTFAGELLCVAGVVPVKQGQGAIAMIGTKAIEKYPTAFLRGSRDVLVYLENLDYDVFYNVVDARNRLHVDWLKWLGFSLIRRVEAYGAAKIPVIEFAKLT